MAKIMPYTDPLSGVVAPESYWKVGGIYIDDISRHARIVFIGYFSQAQRSQNMAAWSHEYNLTDFGYDGFFSTAALDAAGKNVKAVCYDAAMSIDQFFAGSADLL